MGKLCAQMNHILSKVCANVLPPYSLFVQENNFLNLILIQSKHEREIQQIATIDIPLREWNVFFFSSLHRILSNAAQTLFTMCTKRIEQ